jgi:hypothetical protein
MGMDTCARAHIHCADRLRDANGLPVVGLLVVRARCQSIRANRAGDNLVLFNDGAFPLSTERFTRILCMLMKCITASGTVHSSVCVRHVDGDMLAH